MKTPISDFLMEHADLNPVSFHMPGHKGSAIYRRFGYESFLEKIMDCDVTEICGADNLFQTEGIIQEAQNRYARLYGVKRSYLLINGTSGGIIAAILASVPRGGKLIMARNCHKSVFNGLTLGDISPVYAAPQTIEEYGISGEIMPETIEKLLQEHPDAEAVILPSPNYYGICSDIRTIAEIVHRAGKILIVDEAHGAHLSFFTLYDVDGMPEAAENAGADIVIASAHKTLASFTQSALLHVASDRVDQYTLEDKLQCIQSTSPSYLLMASLDINASILSEQGHTLFQEWEKCMSVFYQQARSIPGLSVMRRERMDMTKFNFSLEECGVSGRELEEILMRQYGIFIELYTGNLVMCMTGIGTRLEDVEKLIGALREIAAGRYGKAERLPRGSTIIPQNQETIFPIPVRKRRIALSEAIGKICASSVIPYPPGIPLICPGEKFSKEIVGYIRELRAAGEKVIGVSEEEEIIVGEE